MHINIVKATNIELTESLKQYVEKKLRRVSNKFVDKNDESAQCDVELGKTTEHHKNGNVLRAEFNLHVAGKNMYAAAEEEDLYAAIDEARNDLSRQLKSHRGKRETMLRKGGKKLKQMLRGASAE